MRDASEVVRIKRNKPKKILTDDQIQAILTTVREKSFMIYVMFLLLVHCGMRLMEILTIKRDDLHLEERWLETGFKPARERAIRIWIAGSLIASLKACNMH